ncbi:MAG: superoxide dismutase family protein [Pseudomonadota bacterium]
MKIKQHAALILTAALGTAAATAAPLAAQALGGPDEQDKRIVEVTTADGAQVGTIEFEQMRHGLVVRARLTGLTEGGHGVHLHQTGSCSPDFKAAGGHIDPLDAGHGFDGNGGYHVGDLPNIFAGADGVAKADFFVPQMTLRDKTSESFPFTLNDADGSAIIIHADEDNYIDMDSAGGREACGVIFPAGDQ